MPTEMTLVEAQEIAVDYGDYLNYYYPIFNAIFLLTVPNCLLPHPKETIKEACLLLGNIYKEAGDEERVKAFKGALFCLGNHKDEATAIEWGIKLFTDDKYVSEFATNICKYKQKPYTELHKALHPKTEGDDDN